MKKLFKIVYPYGRKTVLFHEMIKEIEEMDRETARSRGRVKEA